MRAETKMGPIAMREYSHPTSLQGITRVHVFAPDSDSMTDWVCTLAGECFRFDMKRSEFSFERQGRTVDFVLMQDYDSLTEGDMVVLTHAGLRFLSGDQRREITYALAMMDVWVVDEDTFIRDWSRGFPFSQHIG